MKKILVIAFALMLIFVGNNVFAATKEDIVAFVNSQDVCDSSTSAIFNSYKTTFTRLLRQKELSSSDCDRILGYLHSSVGVLNSKGVCKLSDLSKLTSAEKGSIYGALSAGAAIITNAPILGWNTEPVNNETGGEQTVATSSGVDNRMQNIEINMGSSISINTEDNALEIYESGVLVDKVQLDLSKLTYTGPDKMYSIILFTSIGTFLVSIICFILLYTKHSAKKRFVKNILLSIVISSFIVITICLVFKNGIQIITNTLSMLEVKTSGKENTIELNEDHSIKKYPSYGSKYAQISIKDLGIEMDVTFGDDSTILANSVGHSTWSCLPTEGGTVVLSGHNKENILRGLKDAKSGQKIVLDTTYAICTYSIYKTDIITDKDIDLLTQTSNKETIAIYTCYPFSDYIYGNQRFVVYGILEDVNWK